MKVVCIIPARMGSTRFPGKPLYDLCGKTMIMRVYEQACKAKLINGGVYIATDDARIVNEANLYGANTILTGSYHLNGTDRISEAVNHTGGELIVNVQGDEPLIDPMAIDSLISPFLKDNSLEMGTIITKITNPDDASNKDVVKVVKDLNNFALYFSRSQIPFSRDDDCTTQIYKQAGVYIYRRYLLKRLSRLPPTVYEQCEKLEQLRALENGIKIKLVETDYESISVDTIMDAYAVIDRLSSQTV